MTNQSMEFHPNSLNKTQTTKKITKQMRVVGIAAIAAIAASKAINMKKKIEIPVIQDTHAKIYAAVSAENALEMSSWHSCETTHCRAGWVVHLAGETGYALERFHNTTLAAQLIYRESGYQINPSKFYDSNEEALEDMRLLAEGEVK